MTWSGMYARLSKIIIRSDCSQRHLISSSVSQSGYPSSMSFSLSLVKAPIYAKEAEYSGLESNWYQGVPWMHFSGTYVACRRSIVSGSCNPKPKLVRMFSSSMNISSAYRSLTVWKKFGKSSSTLISSLDIAKPHSFSYSAKTIWITTKATDAKAIKNRGAA